MDESREDSSPQGRWGGGTARPEQADRAAIVSKVTGLFLTSALKPEFTLPCEDLCSDFLMLKERETVQ